MIILHDKKMEHLDSIVKDIEDKFKLKLEFISGGNSANYYWCISTRDVGTINNLRSGESIFLGCKTLNKKPIPGLFTDAFALIKVKPSLHYGDVHRDALVSGLTHMLDIYIIEVSSDHIILDAKGTDLKVGNTVEFNLNYGDLLLTMTSSYIIKSINSFITAKEYCETVERLDRYQKQLIPTIIIKEDNSPLISLKESRCNLIFEPSIKKDYKYLVREEVFGKIERISKLLARKDKVLIIRSAWRSFEHQKLLRENKSKIIKKEHPNKSSKEINKIVSYFIASEEKSMHSTGGSVDALIYDLKKDCVMDFGNNDGLKLELNKTCYPFHPAITPKAKKNRKLLMNLFKKEDMISDPKEYWHFDYGNVIWAIEQNKEYAIYDIIKSVLV